VDQYEDIFMGVHFDDSSVDPTIKRFGIHEWNEERFQILGKIRQQSVDFAQQNAFDFYFVSDVDNFIVPSTLESLVNLNLQAVAPMLRLAVPERTENPHEHGGYSNFCFTDESLWFRKTPEYFDILNGRTPGVHQVDLIHCTYLLRSDIYPKVDFLAISGNWEYKNLIISLRSQGVRIYLDSRHDYGILTLSEGLTDAKFQFEHLKYLQENRKTLTETEKAFINIYAKAFWGYRSGSGSYPDNALPYTEYVNKILSNPAIVNILEIGCGDFRLGSKYNLSGKNYLGIDVNAPLIQDLERFETISIKFLSVDFVDERFTGDWDLILVKDVLQHLPNSLIKLALDKIIKSSKFAVICNDRSSENFDVPVGGYRGLDLSRDPFNYDFKKVFEFGLKDVHIHSTGKDVSLEI